jgi:hypothetical protein
MVKFEDIHKQLSPETKLKIKQFIEWVDGVNEDNAIALNDILYELEEEIFNLTVSGVSDDSWD